MLRYSQKVLRELGPFKFYARTQVWKLKVIFPSCLLQKYYKDPVCPSFKHTRTAWRNKHGTDKLVREYLFKYSLGAKSLRDKMDVSLLLPPSSVRGMTTLVREAFAKTIKVPFIRVDNENVNDALKYFKKLILKMHKIKPIETDTDNQGKKVVLLNPLLVKSIDDIKEEFDQVSSLGNIDFLFTEITLSYENWKADEIIKSVLPENVDGGKGYSLIGHIIHLNLREDSFPYKKLIGEVLLEKIPNITLVVNKTNIIHSTYRNFEMEVLAGTGMTDVTVKQNGCAFSFDFAKVYWNPRLATEHERIVNKIKNCDILYDVMAGVGPFSIPAGRKKCKVLANDLNPHSFESLVRNCSSNKVKDYVKCYNLDGHEFIKTALRKSLLKTWHDKHFCGNVHVTMNLPAMAVEFLPSFIGLFEKGDNVPLNAPLPLVHVYMFAKDTNEETAVGMVAEQLEYIVKDSVSDVNNENGNADTEGLSHNSDFGGFKKCVDEVLHVRDVAPNKHMVRVSFTLQRNIIIKNSRNCEGPPNKKMKAL